MAEWCRNRFEITGKSVCLDVLIQWIEGNDAPPVPSCDPAEHTAVSCRLCGDTETGKNGDISALSRAGQSRCRLNNCSQPGV